MIQMIKKHLIQKQYNKVKIFDTITNKNIIDSKLFQERWLNGHDTEAIFYYRDMVVAILKRDVKSNIKYNVFIPDGHSTLKEELGRIQMVTEFYKIGSFTTRKQNVPIKNSTSLILKYWDIEFQNLRKLKKDILKLKARKKRTQLTNEMIKKLEKQEAEILERISKNDKSYIIKDDDWNQTVQLTDNELLKIKIDEAEKEVQELKINRELKSKLKTLENTVMRISEEESEESNGREKNKAETEANPYDGTRSDDNRETTVTS